MDEYLPLPPSNSTRRMYVPAERLERIKALVDEYLQPHSTYERAALRYAEGLRAIRQELEK